MLPTVVKQELQGITRIKKLRSQSQSVNIITIDNNYIKWTPQNRYLKRDGHHRQPTAEMDTDIGI